MTFADAIKIAIRLCKAAGEDRAAHVLGQLPQVRIAENAARMHRTLAAAGMDLQAILDECKAADESRDITAMKVATAKLGMAVKAMEARDKIERGGSDA
jgi:hypothetical protein